MAVKDLTRGVGQDNHLLMADNLADKVVELMEEGEVSQGGDRGDLGHGH